MSKLVSVLKIIGEVTVDMLFEEDEDREKERQLDNLSDGLEGVIVDGECYTRQEARVMQSRGELYDTFY